MNKNQNMSIEIGITASIRIMVKTFVNQCKPMLKKEKHSLFGFALELHVLRKLDMFSKMCKTNEKRAFVTFAIFENQYNGL